LLDVGGGFQQLIEKLHAGWLPTRRSEPSAFSARALRLFAEAFLLLGMSGINSPAGFWQRAYHLILVGGRIEGDGDVRADTPGAEAAFHLKRLIALSALQPESLTARELAWVNDYMEVAVFEAVLSREPVLPETSAFWMNPERDVAPIANVRSKPQQTEGLLHFSAKAMSRRASAHMDWLKTRVSEADVVGLDRDGDLLEPDLPGLPVGLTPTEAISLLGRMRDRWAAPPNREQSRRPQQYSVQVCAGLRAIWDANKRGRGAAKIAEWMVYNESPGGYAIMSVSGVVGLLSAGMALGLRRDASQPWSICIVRWIRSDDPEQVELGLQVVAQACTPVTIGFRGNDARTTVPALILPPLPALRRNQAILAPAGTYSSRRFILVHEGAHLYVAQARVLSLDMQTANVELFQYEIDPYPI
jgi:hypothetical protein